MKTTKNILIMIILCFSFVGIARADSGPLTRQTTFYFQQNGQPVTQAVTFNIKCYGTSMMGSGNKLLKISEISEICQEYGCKFNTNNLFEVYRQNTEYCDIEGEVNGQKFFVSNFVGDNLSELNCRYADYDISNDGRYYRETPEYKSCYNAVVKEYYPSWNGEKDGNLGKFLCDQYKTYEKLIPTTISTEPNGPCYHREYIIKDDICYQIPQDYFDCTAEMSAKKALCKQEQYLEDVTSELAMDSNGYLFEQICEIIVNIPAPDSVSNVNNQENLNTQPTQITNEQSYKNIFSQIGDFFRCLFLKIFGKSC